MASGHIDGARFVPLLHSLRRHPDENVRFAVSVSLRGGETGLLVETLVELSQDPDSDVRDWSTFGLGTYFEIDTQEVRDALVARLDDSDADVRFEAVNGLAARGDSRALVRLLAEVDARVASADPGGLDEAVLSLATATGDSRLRSSVDAVASRWRAQEPDAPFPEDLQRALDSVAPR